MKKDERKASATVRHEHSISGTPPRWTAWVFCFCLVVLALWVMGNVRAIDLDIFHEMALFRAALDQGTIPTEDVFAYTPTVSPSVHHEWGMGAVLYLLTVTLGLGSHGLVLLRLGLLGFIAVACVAIARLRGAGTTDLALAAPLAILLFWPGLSPVRAHMFTFAFLALLLYFLEVDRRGARWWLLAWPVMFIAWLNLHGGFVVGGGMLGLYTVERFVREKARGGWQKALKRTWHLGAAVAATLPLLLINPYGLDYIPYLWHALLLDRPMIPEWAPLWDARFGGVPLFLFGVSVLLLLYTLIRGRRYWRQQPGILLVFVAGLAALDSIRILPIYMVVWMSYVPAGLARTPFSPLLRGLWQRYARPAGATLAAAASVGLWQIGISGAFALELPTQGEGYRQHYPAGAVAYLEEEGFEGNLMTPFGVGAYVSWHLYPEVKVGMDSRYEVAYPPELVQETMRIYQGEGDWREFLDRFPTDAVLAPAEGPLDSLLVEAGRSPDARWVQIYRDDAYAIFAGTQIAAALSRLDRRGERIPGGFP